VQYGDGVVGMMVINGPTTMNYDEDLGVLPVSDWYYETASTRAYIVAHTFGPPPTEADNGLINSTMVSKSGKQPDQTGRKHLCPVVSPHGVAQDLSFSHALSSIGDMY
jgi:hypothetical protein